jgi:hypothetical protein
MLTPGEVLHWEFRALVELHTKRQQPLPLVLYPRGWGYKEGNWVSYNMVSITTLSLLGYFTYIFIDIIIYALECTPWPSGIFQKVGHNLLEDSRGYQGPSESMCGGTLGTNPHQQPPSAWQVSRCWVIWIFLVFDEFAEYSIQKPSTLAQNRLVLFHQIDRIDALDRCTY